MLIALVVVAVMSLVVVVHATDVDVSDDVPWERVVFGLAARALRTDAPEEPDGRRLDLGQLPRARVGGRNGWRRVPRLGARARLGTSGQPLEQEHAVLAGAVVVLHHAIDLEAERLVEGDRLLVRR